jgi:RHH-type transcriptional regulator, rel operon repressor / antitoxin RelB
MSRQIAIRLLDETYERLQALASRTDRTTASYIREALDDLEDVYLAEQVIERIRSGEEQTYSLDEVRQRLGLED